MASANGPSMHRSIATSFNYQATKFMDLSIKLAVDTLRFALLFSQSDPKYLTIGFCLWHRYDLPIPLIDPTLKAKKLLQLFIDKIYLVC